MSAPKTAEPGSAWAELQAAHVLRLAAEPARQPEPAAAPEPVADVAARPLVRGASAKKTPQVSRKMLAFTTVAVALTLLVALDASLYQKRYWRVVIAQGQQLLRLGHEQVQGKENEKETGHDRDAITLASLPEGQADALTVAAVEPAVVAPVPTVAPVGPAPASAPAPAALAVATPAAAKPAWVASKPSVSSLPPRKQQAELGAARFARYEILAIEPHHGPHQQAWLRDANGKTQIVQAGDWLDGVRVISVSFDEGTVKTAQGTLRQ